MPICHEPPIDTASTITFPLPLSVRVSVSVLSGPFLNAVPGTYQVAVRPGKKLAFMGMEWAYDKGWDPNGELDWGLWNVPEYGAFDAYVCALAHFYLGEPALWQEEGSAGWRWADVWSDNPCVFGLVRIGWDRQVLALLNFSAEEARVWVGERTEAVLFDSTGRTEAGRDENGLLSLPALSGRVLRMA